MVDRLPSNQPGQIGQQSGTQQTGGVLPGETSSTSENGPAFKALLDKLQQQAKSLQQDSETLEKPEELSGAVDRARTSLGDALTLSDKLLEAYREAVQQDDSVPGKGGASEGGNAAR